MNAAQRFAAMQLRQQAGLQAARLSRLLTYYRRGYNFYVELNGIVFSFTRVSGLEVDGSLEAFPEGGYNMAPHYIRGGAVKEHVVTLEYGSSNLSGFLEDVKPGTYLEDGVFIGVFGDKSILSLSKMYLLNDCYVKSISFGDLDASQSSLLINRLEISYSSIEMPGLLS
jgi:phage tail-like protein